MHTDTVGTYGVPPTMYIAIRDNVLYSHTSSPFGYVFGQKARNKMNTNPNQDCPSDVNERVVSSLSTSNVSSSVPNYNET